MEHQRRGRMFSSNIESPDNQWSPGFLRSLQQRGAERHCDFRRRPCRLKQTLPHTDRVDAFQCKEPADVFKERRRQRWSGTTEICACGQGRLSSFGTKLQCPDPFITGMDEADDSAHSAGGDPPQTPENPSMKSRRRCGGRQGDVSHKEWPLIARTLNFLKGLGETSMKPDEIPAQLSQLLFPGPQSH